MKKFIVRCDMEGISGIVSYEQAEPGKSEYAIGQRYFMRDLLALVNGLNDGGAEEILIYDEHFFGRNVDIDSLPENVSVINEYVFSGCNNLMNVVFNDNVYRISDFAFANCDLLSEFIFPDSVS